MAKVVSSHFSEDIPEWAYPAVASLLEALRLVDPLTAEHCLRVGQQAFKMARAMGLSEYEQRKAEFSGILHDIGKMGITKGLIHKPAILNPEEMHIVASHPLLSEALVRPLAHNSFFSEVMPIVRGHHERIDGRGYPDGLEGDRIPLLSRLILVVDTLDAMGNDRSYRKAVEFDAICRELQRCAGQQFDAELVRIFVNGYRFWNKDQDPDSFVLRMQVASGLKRVA